MEEIKLEFLQITTETDPKEALRLSKGMPFLFIEDVSDYTEELVEVIKKSGGHKEPFKTQEEIMVYVANNLHLNGSKLAE